MINIQELYGRILKTENQDLIRELLELTTICEYKKGETVIRRGEVPRKLYVLLEGVARGVVQGAKGQEVTLCFPYKSGQFVMPNADFHAEASCTMEAVIPCRVACLPLARIDDVLQKYPQAMKLYLECAVEECDRHIELQNILGQYNATERYLWFYKKYKELIGIVPDKFIASYLHMTPVTISRVRRKIKSKRFQENISAPEEKE